MNILQRGSNLQGKILFIYIFNIFCCRDRSKTPSKTVKTTAVYPTLESAIQHRWSEFTKRQTKEINPALFFVILGVQKEELSWFPLTQLQFPALWQFQSLHDTLPNNLDHLAELETITNQLISAAEVNKQILTSVPHDLIE